MTWRPTGVASPTLTLGRVREVNLNGHSVVLVRLEGGVYALDGLCPHQGGILGEAEVEGDRLVCPEHGAHFRVRDGSVLVDPHGVTPPRGGTSPVDAYPTREVRGMIEVDVD